MDDALPLHIKSLEFDSHQVKFFFFVVVCFFFALFCFLKTYRKRFAASIYKEMMSHMTVNLKKLERTSY